jgi:UDP-glucose 4-epimerase
MKNIVIFGATGTIGVYTAIELKENNYNIFAVGRRIDHNNFFNRHGISYYSLNIKNKDDFDLLPSGNIDAVIHYAGSMPAHMRGYNPKEHIDSIIIGTFNVLEYAKKVNAERIIFSQSISDILYLFGTTNPISPDVEKKFPLTGDHSVYSISKNAAANLIEHYYSEYKIKRFILRLPTIYAYHPNPFYYVNGERRWMGYRLLIDNAIKGNTIEIWGNPQMKKEVVYVKDFTQIVNGALDAATDGGVYNVGTGTGISLEDQIKYIIQVFSPPQNQSKIIYKSDMPNAQQFVLDINKTKEELGYSPRYDYLSYLLDFKKEMALQRFADIWGGANTYV